MATTLLSYTVPDKYKEIVDLIESVDLNKKDIRKKSLKEIMQESVFHGASWVGNNFIA